MTAETIEQWAARTATTLTAKQWVATSAMVEQHDAGPNECDHDSGPRNSEDSEDVARARALLAYRDLHAAELSRFHRRVLLGRGDQ